MVPCHINVNGENLFGARKSCARYNAIDYPRHSPGQVMIVVTRVVIFHASIDTTFPSWWANLGDTYIVPTQISKLPITRVKLWNSIVWLVLRKKKSLLHHEGNQLRRLHLY